MKRPLAPLLLLALLVIAASPSLAQDSGPPYVRAGSTLPPSCTNARTLYHLTQTDGLNAPGLYRCNGSAFVSAGGASGVSASSPTTSRLAKFASSSSLSNSLLADDGTNVTLTSGTLKAQHFGGSGTAPTCAANSSPGGTGATCSLSGSDSFGTVTVTSGASPGGNGELATVTFNAAYSSAPHCVVVPANQEAADYVPGGSGSFWPTTTTTTLVINLSGILAGATQYKFSYHCGQ